MSDRDEEEHQETAAAQNFPPADAQVEAAAAAAAAEAAAEKDEEDSQELRRQVAALRLDNAKKDAKIAALELDNSTKDEKIAAVELDKAALELDKAALVGTYYSTIDEVWGKQAVPFDSSSFDLLIRETAPIFIPRRPQPPPQRPPTVNEGHDDERLKHVVYALTKNCAEAGGFIPAEDAPSQHSRVTRSPEDKIAIWPTDIFGNDPEESQIAHLVPASYNVSTLYRDVAICALGLEKEATWDVTQKAIHGAKRAKDVVVDPSSKKNAPGNETERADGAADADAASVLRSGAGGSTSASTTSSRTVNRTGIKHFVPNMIRLFGQETYFDKNPCLIIVPVMKSGTVKAWNGGSYEAIVMVEKWEDLSAARACTAIQMVQQGPVAGPGQIERARRLLSCVVKGMAYSLKERFPESFQKNLNDKQRDMLEKLRNDFSNSQGRGVIIPKRRPPNSEQPLRVRLVRFASANSRSGHPAPDPFLLAVRAAVNWSWRHDQRLMAAAEPNDLSVDGDYDDDDLFRLGEQEFLEWREEVWEERERQERNVSREELARRLGQPDGYKGNDDDDDDADADISGD